LPGRQNEPAGFSAVHRFFCGQLKIFSQKVRAGPGRRKVKHGKGLLRLKPIQANMIAIC